MFAANSVYELPFRTAKTDSSRFGVMRKMISGWSMSWIATARSGRPVNVTASRPAADAPNGYNLSQRPDLLPGVSLVPPEGPTVSQWINPAAFRVPGPGTWGNAGRNIARGPGLVEIDAGLSKRFTIGERTAIQFRGEVFNVFNRSQLGNPSGDITVPTQFGTIRSTLNTTPIGTGTPRQLQFMLRLSF